MGIIFFFFASARGMESRISFENCYSGIFALKLFTRINNTFHLANFVKKWEREILVLLFKLRIKGKRIGTWRRKEIKMAER